MNKLYIVPTPIGNLKDITLRAIETLKNVDFILAEDTRTSHKLLNHYEIQKKVLSFHQHNEHKIISSLIEKIKGNTVALISDAGTPGISDAAYLLVRACIDNSIEVECLPGATALIPALVISGLPTSSFYFHGFLPHKKGRLKHLEEIKNKNITSILYESPHRLIKTLEQIILVFGEMEQVSVSRELTKLHEETIRGTANQVLTHFKNHTIKGEVVIVISAMQNQNYEN